MLKCEPDCKKYEHMRLCMFCGKSYHFDTSHLCTSQFGSIYVQRKNEFSDI